MRAWLKAPGPSRAPAASAAGAAWRGGVLVGLSFRHAAVLPEQGGRATDESWELQANSAVLGAPGPPPPTPTCGTTYRGDSSVCPSACPSMIVHAASIDAGRQAGKTASASAAPRQGAPGAGVGVGFTGRRRPRSTAGALEAPHPTPAPSGGCMMRCASPPACHRSVEWLDSWDGRLVATPAWAAAPAAGLCDADRVDQCGPTCRPPGGSKSTNFTLNEYVQMGYSPALQWPT